jgi:hypothetical protein
MVPLFITHLRCALETAHVLEHQNQPSTEEGVKAFANEKCKEHMRKIKLHSCAK